MQIIQIVYGKIPMALMPYMDSVRRAWPGADYRLVECKPIADPIARCIAADALRFQMVREIGPGMLYADLDVEIVAPFSIDEGPHFAFRRDQPACFLWYGLTDKFIDAMDSAMKKRGVLGTTYGWPAKVLRDAPVAKIPDAYYRHHAYSLNTMRR